MPCFFLSIKTLTPPSLPLFPQDVDGKSAWDLAADAPAVLDLLNDPKKAFTI